MISDHQIDGHFFALGGGSHRPGINLRRIGGEQNYAPRLNSTKDIAIAGSSFLVISLDRDAPSAAGSHR